jgi:intraflagellar transport protein 122
MKLLEQNEHQVNPDNYRPLVVDAHILKSLRFEEVFVVDLTHLSKAMTKRYYKNMSPEIAIKLSEPCGKFFIQDEYEFAYMEQGCCPFSKHVEKDKGVKAVFGSLADMQNSNV